MNTPVTGTDNRQILRRITATAGAAWFAVLGPMDSDNTNSDRIAHECGVFVQGSDPGQAQKAATQLLSDALQVAGVSGAQLNEPAITSTGVSISCRMPEAHRLAIALWESIIDSNVILHDGPRAAAKSVAKSAPQAERGGRG